MGTAPPPPPRGDFHAWSSPPRTPPAGSWSRDLACRSVPREAAPIVLHAQHERRGSRSELRPGGSTGGGLPHHEAMACPFRQPPRGDFVGPAATNPATADRARSTSAAAPTKPPSALASTRRLRPLPGRRRVREYARHEPSTRAPLSWPYFGILWRPIPLHVRAPHSRSGAPQLDPTPADPQWCRRRTFLQV